MMKAKSLFFSLLAMIGFVASATAQIATIPYSCDFESSTELACWRFQNTANNRWTFGHATNNGGTTSMYISNDNGLTNSFTYGWLNWLERFMVISGTMSDPLTREQRWI